MNRIARIETRLLINSLYIIGLTYISAMMVFAPKYEGGLPQDLLFSTGFLFWALAGMTIMIRQEGVIVFFYVRGKGAIALGFVMMIPPLFLASLPILGRILER